MLFIEYQIWNNTSIYHILHSSVLCYIACTVLMCESNKPNDTGVGPIQVDTPCRLGGQSGPKFHGLGPP